MNYANYSLAREVTRWSDILQEDIEKIVQANDKVTDSLKSELNSVYINSKLMCTVILAITAVVIIFVIVIIITAVISPLKKMNKELDIIINSINARHGDLSKRISVKQSNEIGRVSANINEFTSKLESIMRTIISSSKNLDNSISNVAVKAGTANVQVDSTYYSQGNSNFRDVNQNRRNDVYFFLFTKNSGIKTFFNLIQLDGYNPLVLNGSRFEVKDIAKCKKITEEYFGKEYAEGIVKMLEKSFTPGSLLMGLHKGRQTMEKTLHLAKKQKHPLHV